MAKDGLREADDAALVRALADGDEPAMVEVVRRHRQPVVAFARRLVGDPGRADDISQDVFLRLWERSDRFDPERGSLRAFLLALTHGRALDALRADSSRRTREECHAATAEVAMRPPETQVVAQSVADAVRRALAAIPEAERRAVELAYFGGHTYRTVAEMLDEPEGTVKSRIRTGLTRLRSALAAQELQGP